ncbi:MAG: glycosyltransferase family 39 protein [Sphingomicrobium sp.]
MASGSVLDARSVNDPDLAAHVVDAGRARALPILLGSILVMGAVIRLAASDISLWFDETASLAFAREPLGHLWGDWMLRETNPPLFYTFLKGWIGIVGGSDAALRGLPILIGLGGVVAMFLLARAIGGPRAGLLGAALLALSAAHVDFSLQLRGYGLGHTAVMFASLGMVLFLQRRAAGALILYAAAAAVALYSHTTLLLFVLLANGAMVVLLRHDRPALARWIGVNLVVALLWSWWGWITFRQLGLPHNFSWIAVPSAADAWLITKTAYLPAYHRSGTSGGDVLLLAALVVAAGMAVRRRSPELILLAVLALGGPLLFFVISLHTPILLPRTLFWASGPLIALVATSVTAMPDRRLSAIVAAALLAVSAVGLVMWWPDRESEDWRGAARVVREQGPGVDIIVADDSVALALAHYLSDRGASIVVVDDPGTGHERWASGMFDGRHVDQGEARALLRQRCSALFVARGGYDALPVVVPGRVGVQQFAGVVNPAVALWQGDCEPDARPR